MDLLLPVQSLFTPDILDEPTIVPFQQSTSHFYQDVVLVMLESHLVLSGEIKHLHGSRSDLECLVTWRK
jgi:hypothetical protein